MRMKRLRKMDGLAIDLTEDTPPKAKNPKAKKSKDEKNKTKKRKAGKPNHHMHRSEKSDEDYLSGDSQF